MEHPRSRFIQEHIGAGPSPLADRVLKDKRSVAGESLALDAERPLPFPAAAAGIPGVRDPIFGYMGQVGLNS